MTSRITLTLAGCVAAAALWWAWSSRGTPPVDPSSAVASAPPAALASAAAVTPPPLAAASSDAAPLSPAPAASETVTEPVHAPVPLGSGEVPDFKVNAAGNLVNDAQTRNGLERLLALNDRPQAQALLQGLSASMPATAHRQLMDAFYNYQNYSDAVTQAFPPGQAPANEDEALQQLDALHALRVERLGPNVAEAYFAEEEKISRDLIAAMKAQNDPNLSVEEKARRAQQAAPPGR